MSFRTMDDFNFANKTILIRADLNTSYDDVTHKIEDSERIKEYSKTIKELAQKKGKVVILAHQGRKDTPDFIHLKEHAELLSKHIGKKVNFIDDIVGNRAIDAIKALKPGNILLLDNVRFLDDEVENKTAKEHSKGKLVRTLAPLADVFVNDAFSVAHRSHASIVGFTTVLPSIAGRVMVREWSSIQKMESESCARPPIEFVLGGDKPDDCLQIMEHIFEKKPEPKKIVLTSGVIGELFLIADGFELGKHTMEYLEKREHIKILNSVKKLLKRHPNLIQTPIDVAYDGNGRREITLDLLPADNQILDIGSQTVDKYVKILNDANCVIVKGTAGVYEKNNFEMGTKRILETVASLEKFTLVGGGDTNRAIKILGIDRKRFSYVSIAGGAFIMALSGKKLPAIEALKQSK